MGVNFFIILSEVTFGQEDAEAGHLHLGDLYLCLFLQSQIVAEVGLHISFECFGEKIRLVQVNESGVQVFKDLGLVSIPCNLNVKQVVLGENLL